MDEKYVVSLELSKKLKELRVPQRSEFVWRGSNKIFRIYCVIITNDREDYYDELTKKNIKAYSAYLSDELLEWLPDVIYIHPNYLWCIIRKFHDCYEITYRTIDFEYKLENRMVDTILPNVLAQMLIYLLEHNLIKAEELK